MNPNGRHDQRRATQWRVGEVAMDTFTIRLPRWPILLRLQGRDPLVRKTDRVEALVLVLTVLLSLLAAPITAAIGTAVYDSARHTYAVQARTRHTVTATVIDVPAAQQFLRAGTITVSARWTAAGTDHAGVLEAPSTAEIDDPIEIWVDEDGVQVPAPTPTSHAAAEAAIGALVIWMTMAAIAATLYALTRTVCDRIRFAGWQHGLDSMVGNGDGHQYPGRTSER